mmetsp:Transcript_27170/g.75930  ORF Transcript_27170/g.75930 Transcript_27170/m.75930 type:complete len:1255 (-) Transcript_27170:75-3839(-)|eukprot:CAMPEP_0119122590 /NCGR_PEP_ID=MMETSP1310-20130426/2799_1 /TAXON_ID=464262 /ORGANISM="Genus nov. species nov., Strain RCC2339" /LENGTH=1254 /DNA_ID=CAMNT_0007112271 /DNA_START=319 /DNA_END=4083 /DNA_ORIENTATION=-
MSFGGTERSRGTIRLRTLRPPGVKTLKGMFDKKDLDDEHLALADEAQLDPLLNLLTHDHPTVRALVEEAIMNLEKIDDDEIIMEKRGLQALYKLLTFKDPACQRESIWAVAILAGISEQNHDPIKVDIGWLTIMSLARKPQLKEEEIQRGAVTCISNLCLNEDNHEMVIKEGGLELLKTLAGSTQDLRIKRPIANAFANLATDEEFVEEVVANGGLEMMIGFANENDDELVCGAIHTIANLADAEEMKARIVAAGGLDVIIKLLKSKDAMIVKGATNALANLATEREYQTELIKLGVAEPLTALAKKSKNPEIQLRVVLAINNIVSNPDLRDPMRKAGVVRPLRSLARSRNHEIKREAIEALTELGETIGNKKKKKTAMAGGVASRRGGGDDDDDDAEYDDDDDAAGKNRDLDPLAGGSLTVRVQPVDPTNGQRCGTGQIVTLDSLKVADLFAKLGDVFGKKCSVACHNGVLIEKDEQMRAINPNDVIEATFALSCKVQPVDPRTGNPSGDPFDVDLQNCKVNDLKQVIGNKSGRNPARILHNGQLVGNDEQLHNVRSGEVLQVAFAPIQVRAQPVDPKTGQPNAKPFVVQLVSPDFEELKARCCQQAGNVPVLGMSLRGQRLVNNEQLKNLRNGDTIAVAYQEVKAAPPAVPQTLNMQIFVQPLDPKTGQPFGQAFTVVLDELTMAELQKKVNDGSGGRPVQALTHRGQIIKQEEQLKNLRNGDAIGVVFGRNLKVTPIDPQTQQPCGETFNVLVDSLKVEDLKNTIAQTTGRDIMGVTHNGQTIVSDDQLQYLRNGDSIGAVFAAPRREAKQDKTGESMGEDWDEEEDERETEEDRRVKSELALIMMELWEPKGEDRVEDALRRLLFLAQKVRNRKLIRIAGAIPILVNMLKSADPSLPLTRCQSLALECIATLSRNVLNREEIRKNGGLSPLVSFIHKKEQKDKVEALKCLKECSKSPKNKALLRKAGFIETLIPYLLPDNEPIQCLVLDVLTVVCFNDQASQQAIREAKGIQQVVKLTESQKVEIKKRAVRTLGAICGNNRKIQAMLKKIKAITGVVAMLGDKEEEVQKAAAGCIAAIADNDHNNQNAVRKAGGVRLLIAQLSCSNDSVKEQACAALRALAKSNGKVQADVREGGALKTLVDLLTSPSEGVLIHATGALMELARDCNKNADAICFGGSVPLLVAGLNTNSEVLQYHSEGAIWAIARKSKKRKDAFIKAKAIPPLRKLAQSPNEQVRRGAVWALDVLEKKK